MDTLAVAIPERIVRKREVIPGLLRSRKPKLHGEIHTSYGVRSRIDQDR
jgi:hypothetical protein